MSYKLTYTGQQVQDYLDKVATGQVGGTSDYDTLENRPIINVDLDNTAANTADQTVLYHHVGESTAIYKKAALYYTNGTSWLQFKGEKGDTGTTGLEYAICQTKLVFNVDPKINYFYDLSEQGELLYNRSVSQYDKIIYFWENSVSGDTFLIIGHIGGDSTIKAPLYVYAVLATRGAAPNINISASVDNNVGTPSAEVTKSGTNSNPTFAFDFKKKTI